MRIVQRQEWFRWLKVLTGIGLGTGILLAAATDTPDPRVDELMNLFVKKGLVTQDDVAQIKAEADAMRTNNGALPAASKWKISDAIKSVELFGDLRLRYEHRQGTSPADNRLELDRGRYAVRLGLRGDASDDFYYGLRLESAANPRSPWVTFGTSSGGIPLKASPSSGAIPYQGPFGKDTSGMYLGQVYLGWHPEKWLDLTAGRMPNPLFTTPMVWDSDLSPEGVVERFHSTVGDADFFANLGQFLYQDTNPDYSSGGMINNDPFGLLTRNVDQLFLLTWQAGFNYHFTTNVSAKMAGTLYQYVGRLQTNVAPYFGSDFIGEGAYTGPNGTYVNGASGYGVVNVNGFGYNSFGFPNNQVGVDHLLVLEVPLELNFKLGSLDAKIFGDAAYNLQGRQRAEAAAAGYANYLGPQQLTPSTVTPFAPQKNDCKAWQAGFALGNQGSLGMVYGTTSRKHGWEFRTYWQHVEQYALDPNLMDSDFFEGRANLQGVYVALAYGFTDNAIGTFRYGYASRINNLLGTGGSNQDMPWINPIQDYQILQLDFTLRF